MHPGALLNLRRVLALPAIAALSVLAACGSESAAGPTDHSQLVVGILAPFTGADAVLGPAYYAACLPAVRVINAAGGAYGHTLTCQKFDTRGDPADAVPAAQQMIANNPNLMVVVGCTSDEASPVVPIMDRAHVPHFCMTGQSEFNKSSAKYFHRLVPPDEFDAYAMVGSALFKHNFKKIALVFGNDPGSQAFVDPATKAITALGGTVTINQAITLGQPSYRTEVTKMLKTHPDVIFTEALGGTDATYLKEVKTLNGSMIPVMGTSATIDPAWFSAVKDAIGVQDLVNNFTAVDLGVSFSGPGYTEFKTNLDASKDQFADAPKYSQRGSTLHLYDGIIMTALAMDLAKSKDRTVYNPKIIDIGNGTTGAVEYHTYKEAQDAINAGKAVRWVGAGGPTNFNQYNNSQQGYILVKYDTSGGEVQYDTLSQAQTNQVITAGGG